MLKYQYTDPRRLNDLQIVCYHIAYIKTSNMILLLLSNKLKKYAVTRLQYRMYDLAGACVIELGRYQFY